MIIITQNPISHDDLHLTPYSEKDGAEVTFIGMVRNHAEGRKVLYLEYESYEEMAISQIEYILDDVRKKWNIENIRVIHRIGRLEIGDIAIGIAVGSPHRKEAFLACHHIIDRIKETVPIWKKEFYEDAVSWK